MASANLAQKRLSSLKRLLSEGKNSTQEELKEALSSEGYDVTQSTISRDLRRLEAVKAIDSQGRTIYRLSALTSEVSLISQSMSDMIISINHNNFMIILHTTPGSASLVARHLDLKRPGDILGTIAGDDTIFVAPARGASMEDTIIQLEESFKY